MEAVAGVMLTETGGRQGGVGPVSFLGLTAAL